MTSLSADPLEGDKNPQVAKAVMDMRNGAKLPNGTALWPAHHTYQHARFNCAFSKFIYDHDGNISVHDSSLIAFVPSHIHKKITTEQGEFWAPYFIELSTQGKEVDSLEELALALANDPADLSQGWKPTAAEVWEKYDEFVKGQAVKYSPYWVTAKSKLSDVANVLKNIDKAEEFGEPGVTQFRKSFGAYVNAISNVNTTAAIKKFFVTALAFAPDIISAGIVIQGLVFPTQTQQMAFDDLLVRFDQCLNQLSQTGHVDNNSFDLAATGLDLYLAAINAPDEFRAEIATTLYHFGAPLA